MISSEGASAGKKSPWDLEVVKRGVRPGFFSDVEKQRPARFGVIGRLLTGQQVFQVILRNQHALSLGPHLRLVLDHPADMQGSVGGGGEIQCFAEDYLTPSFILPDPLDDRLRALVHPGDRRTQKVVVAVQVDLGVHLPAHSHPQDGGERIREALSQLLAGVFERLAPLGAGPARHSPAAVRGSGIRSSPTRAPALRW